MLRHHRPDRRPSPLRCRLKPVGWPSRTRRSRLHTSTSSPNLYAITAHGTTAADALPQSQSVLSGRSDAFDPETKISQADRLQGASKQGHSFSSPSPDKRGSLSMLPRSSFHSTQSRDGLLRRPKPDAQSYMPNMFTINSNHIISMLAPRQSVQCAIPAHNDSY